MANSSKNGNKYEKQVYNIIKNTCIDGEPFITQKEEELGGSSIRNDIVFNYNNETYGLEIKTAKTPDWMQCSIKYNNETEKWEGTKKCKIPNECREMFDKLINNINLYNGDIPPIKCITNDKWLKIKSKTDKWDDHYIDIPSDTIRKLYLQKGCQYIQISNGYGLYRLGEDPCGFGVPKFKVEQRIRIRIKPHSTRKDGTRSLSVMAACQPENIKKLTPSPYSLDKKNKLPTKLQ